MEPRHHELEADQLADEREPDDDELELGPDSDDTGYDDELDDDE